MVSDTVHFSTISYVRTTYTSSHVMVFLGSIVASRVELNQVLFYHKTLAFSHKKNLPRNMQVRALASENNIVRVP